MLLRMSFVSFIVTFGFGILFNIKGKKLIFAALGGGLSWYCYSLPLSLGLSEVSSLFISALVFSTYSEILDACYFLYNLCFIPIGSWRWNVLYNACHN